MKSLKLSFMALAALAFTACTGHDTKNATVAEDAAQPAAEAEAPATTQGTTYDRTATVIEYDPEVLGASVAPDTELPVIIDFNAVWCGPCRQFKPVFDKVAEEYNGRAIFLSIDVDKNPTAAEQFGVSAIPQVTILMPDGTTSTQVGSMDETQFKQMIGF